MKRPHSITTFITSSLAVASAAGTTFDSSITFAVIPKNTANEFFAVVEKGCLAQAALLPGVSCLYVGPDHDDPAAQAGFIDAIINGTYGRIDGISVSVSNAEITGEAIDRATEAGIPVITFDSDAEDSSRRAYIGTDNLAFGTELGKLLDQLAPAGGTYGILAAAAPNVLARVQGVRERLKDSKWVEVDSSYKDCLDDIDRSVEIMYEFAGENVDAIIPVGGWPMYADSKWKEFVDLNRNLMLVVGDTLDVQLTLMNQGYVNGLVGQLPFSMGEMSINYLFKIVQGEHVEEEIFGTALLEVIQFPLVLPEYTVNHNYLGSLAILGYVLFATIAIVVLCLAAWVYRNRKTRVVRSSQPFFLHMVLVGVVVFASAMVPLTFDSGSGQYSQGVLDASCMATPWLMTIGFTTMFSALYSKLYRINKLFHNPQAFKRIKITEKDVLKPYLIMMFGNIVTLSCWTALAPLTYQRFDYPGNDDWNRVIATYGVCSSKSEEANRNANAFVPFLVIIAAINFGLVVLANVQAYQARTIHTEYSESKYITTIMASMLQAFALVVPCIFLLWDIPRAYFTILVVVVFCTCGVVLFFMFYPKVNHTKTWKLEQQEKARKKAAMRARVINDSVGDRGRAAESETFYNSSRHYSEYDDGLQVAIVAEPTFKNSITPSAPSVEGKRRMSNGSTLNADSPLKPSCEDQICNGSDGSEEGLKLSILARKNFRDSSLSAINEMKKKSSDNHLPIVMLDDNNDQVSIHSEGSGEGLMLSILTHKGIMDSSLNVVNLMKKKSPDNPLPIEINVDDQGSNGSDDWDVNGDGLKVVTVPKPNFSNSNNAQSPLNNSDNIQSDEDGNKKKGSFSLGLRHSKPQMEEKEGSENELKVLGINGIKTLDEAIEEIKKLQHELSKYKHS